MTATLSLDKAFVPPRLGFTSSPQSFANMVWPSLNVPKPAAKPFDEAK